MQIVTPAQRVHVEEYVLNFEWRNDPGAGFSFPCSKTGVVDLERVAPTALDNLQKCLDGSYDVVKVGVKDYSYSYYEVATGECSCGRQVELTSTWANTCECGLEYNAFGQLLVARSQWFDEL